jgi:hypothetical protein
MGSEPSENNLKYLIDRSFKDPIAAILLKYSNLTKTQFESLMINHIIDNMIDNELSYDKKALFRSKNVSRGSFSRTLVQARRNIISSIYTVLLMMYVGIFDKAPLEDYKDLAEKLREYTELIRSADEVQSRHILQRIDKELLEGIRSLANTKSLKNL